MFILPFFLSVGYLCKTSPSLKPIICLCYLVIIILKPTPSQLRATAAAPFGTQSWLHPVLSSRDNGRLLTMTASSLQNLSEEQPLPLPVDVRQDITSIPVKLFALDWTLQKLGVNL